LLSQNIFVVVIVAEHVPGADAEQHQLAAVVPLGPLSGRDTSASCILFSLLIQVWINVSPVF
jgi:hypothetical protein